MALATYSDLLTAIGNWLQDSGLSARIPEFITLTEAEFNRRLRTPEMEVRATASLTGEYVALPTDFIGMRAIHIEGSPDYALEHMAAGDLLRRFSGYETGTPQAYAIVDGQLLFAPVPTSGTVELVYYRSIPSLTADNTTNWLMTAHPDAYLFGCLMQAEFYGWNDGRLPTIAARYGDILEQINNHGRRQQWGAAPIMPKPAPFQVRGVRV